MLKKKEIQALPTSPLPTLRGNKFVRPIQRQLPVLPELEHTYFWTNFCVQGLGITFFHRPASNISKNNKFL